MKSLLQSPPRTMMELYKTLPEGTLAELIDNQIYMSPSPVYNHQKVLQILFRKLSEKITDTGRGEVILAPYDVYLDEEYNVVQPDIIIVLNENRHIIDVKGHIHGVPDVLIEILSSGNKNHDLVRKKDLYQKFGVKEYWIVDPETRLASGFSLSNFIFELIAEDIGILKSKLLNASLTF